MCTGYFFGFILNMFVYKTFIVLFFPDSFVSSLDGIYTSNLIGDIDFDRVRRVSVKFFR